MARNPLFIHHLQCRDLDDLSSQVRSLGYRLDRTQLGPGPGACSMRIARARRLTCVVESIGVPFQNRATTPAGRMTFGVILKTSAPVRYAGMSQGRDEIRVGPPSSAIDIVTRSSQIGAHLAIDLAWFEDLCGRRRSSLPSSWLPSEPEVVRHPEVARSLRRLIWSTFRKGNTPPRDEEAWAAALAAVIVDGLYGSPASVDRRHHQAAFHHDRVARAQTYVEEHLAETIRLRTLCDVAGVGLRTLQRAFREELGLTPMAFVEARRLVAARRRIRRRADGDASVAASAAACGLHHPGRFAAAYCALFGEYPRKTARHAVRHDGDR